MPKGHVESVTPYGIRGWAVDDDPLVPARVSIAIDGIPVATVRCGGFRVDLRDAGLREGYAEFKYAVPEGFRDGKEHKVVIRHHASGAHLWAGVMCFDVDGDSTWRADARDGSQHCIVARTHDRSELAHMLHDHRRLAVVATYRTNRTILSGQRMLVDYLRREGYVVVYVDVPSAEDVVSDDSWTDERTHLIRRLNYGYDFASWSAGLAEALDELHRVDEILLINDSALLVRANSDILRRMRALDADVVGLTESFEHSYHLQSSIMMFKDQAMTGRFLQGFFDSYKVSSDKAHTIVHGEIGLSTKARNQGLRLAALVPYETLASSWLDRVDWYLGEAQRTLRVFNRDRLADRFAQVAEAILFGQPLNPTHFFWDILIEECGSPFLKKEFITLNPSNVPTVFRLPDVLAKAPPEMVAAVSEARKCVPGLKAHFVARPSPSKRTDTSSALMGVALDEIDGAASSRLIPVTAAAFIARG